ncbi:MAG: hypothetical protein HY303_16910 [Candidatus Wallbacteria bacterium]|nr:hypothetical protein [Candidatus Wallbacteria bacterium]
MLSLGSNSGRRLPLIACVALALAWGPQAAWPHPEDGSNGGLHTMQHEAALRQLAEQIGSTNEADISLRQLNLVIDAPWRVQIRPEGPNYIPVLFFFPETKKDWRRIKIVRMRLVVPQASGESLIWEDTAAAGPVVGQSQPLGFDGRQMIAVDSFGKVSTDLDLVQERVAPSDPLASFRVAEIDDSNRGWHVLVRLPIPQALCQKNHQATATLLGQIDYKRLPEMPNAPADDKTYTIRRKLFIDLDTDGFPTFDGWRYYDTHLHTCAEYDTDLSIKAIRKSYGGPIQMVKEAAYCIGMLEAPDKAKHRVITTDHNCFYSDDELVKCGPSAQGAWDNPIKVEHPEFTPYFREKNGKVQLRGQKEYENYLDNFGITTGEEITLEKGGGFLGLISGTLGSHMLTYSSRHFMGPFHGGRFLIFKFEENPNPLEVVLESMAADLNFKRGFAYAAHPFSESDIERNLLSAFSDKEVKIALKGEFIRRIDGQDKDFVFKGWQGWNGKSSRGLDTNTILPDRTLALLEDPTWHRDWQAGKPNWDDGLQFGLGQYHKMLSESCSFSTHANPDVKFIRKFFFSGGTDAHGDFNRDSGLLARGLTALPAQLMRYLKIFSMSDNAFGKVRTYVDPTDLQEGSKLTAEERALRAFAHGHSVVTDGPILTFVLDANTNFDSSPDKLQWHPEAVAENADGLIGGDGNMDGLRTMLVAEGEKNVRFRYRWKGANDFGGPLKRIEIYKDDAGGAPQLVTVQRNSGPARVLQHQGELDPESPVDASGWRDEGLGEARHPGEPVESPITVPCAISLCGFTERTSELPYDFRCYTNPVWAVPVRLTRQIAASGRTGSTLPPGALTVTLAFPISMSPRPCEVRVVPLDESGRSFGKGVALSAVEAPGRVNGWAKNMRYGVASSDFAVANKDAPLDLTSTHSGTKFCVYVKDPVDANGNALNAVAWVVDLAQP